MLKHQHTLLKKSKEKTPGHDRDGYSDAATIERTIGKPGAGKSADNKLPGGPRFNQVCPTRGGAMIW